MKTLSALTPEQESHLQAWRATALERMPYMGALLFSMRPVNHPGVDTFAVDKHHRLYINFENTIHRGAQFCAEALMHEASHLLAEHDFLAETTGVLREEQRLWNYAGDCAINDDLRDAGCTLLAGHGVFGANIGMADYLTPMDYMAKLRELRDKAEAKKKAGQGQPGKGQDQDDDGQGSGKSQQDDGDGDEQDQDASGQGAQQSHHQSDDAASDGGGNGQDEDDDLPLFKGCGSGSGGESAPGELGDDDMGGDAPGIDPVDRELVRIATASAIQQHQASHGIGSVPGGFASMVDQILAPTKTPWDRLLAANMRRCVASKAGYAEATYRRRNRRRMNETLRTSTGTSRGRVIAPGSITPVPSVHFYRDTSASMGAERLAKVSAEVVSIAKKMGIRGDDLLVSDVDTMVYDSRRFTGAKMLDSYSGHGGTDMGEAIAHACSLRQKPAVVVIATDGETGWPEARPGIPVIVLLVNASEYWKERVPAWAKVVEVDND